MIKQSHPIVTWAAIVAAIMLGVAGWAAYRSGAVLRAATGSVQHSFEMNLSLERLLSGLRDAEAGQRGVLIVARVEVLEPYRAALPVIDAEYQRLVALTADSPAQRQRLRTLRPLIDARLQRLAQAIAAGRYTADTGPAVIRAGEGKQTMDRIRDAVADMQREEAITLAQFEAQLKRAQSLNIASQLAVVLLAVALVALMVRIARRDADRRKDEFLATLAHELRNPLSPILAAAHLLRLPSTDEPSRRWAAGVIDRQVGTMRALLDDLLEMSCISRGALQLQKRRVVLRSVIDAAIELARPLIDARKHSLELEGDGLDSVLEADPLRLTQVLGNLLNNAAKYTEPGGRITLSARPLRDAMEIVVQDSGVGLAAADVDRIFDLFTQVVQPGAPGGIGLALVRRLVEMHGGHVSASSEGIGRGSSFRVVLPLLDHDAAATDARTQQAADHPLTKPAAIDVTIGVLGRVRAERVSGQRTDCV
jgi:signal transduction histidine kinase